MKNIFDRPTLICGFCCIHSRPSHRVYLITSHKGFRTLCIACCISLSIHVGNIITL